LLFNKTEKDEWLSVHKAAKNSGLIPTAIYWFIGEPPGRLGRSKLRGIFAIVYKPHNARNNGKVNIVFRYPLKKIISEVNIDEKTEIKAFNNMIDSLKKIFDKLEPDIS
jgi:hypothetical protein